MTVITRKYFNDFNAQPYSIRTLGLGVGRLSGRDPQIVRSATNTAALSIFAKIVSKIGGEPGTPFVSLSTCNPSRTASSTFRSFAILPTAISSALSIKFRPSLGGLSFCHEKKTVRLISLLSVLMYCIRNGLARGGRCAGLVSVGLVCRPAGAPPSFQLTHPSRLR